MFLVTLAIAIDGARPRGISEKSSPSPTPKSSLDEAVRAAAPARWRGSAALLVASVGVGRWDHDAEAAGVLIARAVADEIGHV